MNTHPAPNTMCDLSNDERLARAIALSSFQQRVETYSLNQDAVAYCRACFAPISKQDHAKWCDIFCVECRAMQDRTYLPNEQERDEIIRRHRARCGGVTALIAAEETP